MSSLPTDSLLQTGLFILISYMRRVQTNTEHIPTDITFVIVKHIAFDTLLQWQLHFINTMIKLQQYKTAHRALAGVRQTILLHGCPYQRLLPITKNEDTLRGKLWKVLIGLGCMDSNKYQQHIQKGEENKSYVKIRGDTRRTFRTSNAYNSRVSESSVVRVLNSYVHETGKPYMSAQDSIVGVLLYVMPELDAYESYMLLMHNYFPTYFYFCNCQSIIHSHQLIGCYAASYLAWDVLRVSDDTLFKHLKPLPPMTYLFPLIASLQTICKPFAEIPKLWDFLFSFGFHLSPVMAAAHIIVHKKEILLETAPTLLQNLFSQRKWMNGATKSKAVIDCSMELIIILKQSENSKLWNNILHHCTDLNVAVSIKNQHKQGPKLQLISNCNENLDLSVNESENINIDCDEDVSDTDTESEDDEESSSSWTSDDILDVENENEVTSYAKIRSRYRLQNLNEFELKEEEIEMFNLCQQTHNQTISEYHAGFKFVDMHCMNDEIIKHWNSNLQNTD